MYLPFPMNIRLMLNQVSVWQTSHIRARFASKPSARTRPPHRPSPQCLRSLFALVRQPSSTKDTSLGQLVLARVVPTLCLYSQEDEAEMGRRI